MANISLNSVISSFITIETEAEILGVLIPQKGIGIYVRETNGVKITDGITSCDALPYINTDIDSKESVGKIGTYTPINAPSNYLELDGTRVSKTLYPDIFNIFGAEYGETKTHFNLPDTRRLFSYGVFVPTQINLNYWIKYK